MKTQTEEIQDESKESEEFKFEKAEDIISTLKRLPKLILDKEIIIMNAEIQKGDMIAATKTAEDDIARGITKETISVDVEIPVDKRAMSKEEKAEYKPKYQKELKPKYTNEIQRTTAINVRLINHKEYNIFKEKADKLDKWISKSRIELSYIKRMFRVAESLMRVD